MHTLVVAELYPWPPVDGYRQRLHHIVGGLTQAGPVDVVAPLRPGMSEPAGPPWPGVASTSTPTMGEPAGPRAWIGEWLRGGEPRGVGIGKVTEADADLGGHGIPAKEA